MQFETTSELRRDPHVRIFFIGLNILAPADNTTCQAFVHNQSDDHELLIEVRQKRRGKPDLILMRRPGPLAFIDDDPDNIHGLVISTEGLASGKGVKAYNGPKADEGTTLFDAFILPEILDVSPGEVDPDGGLPSISIDHGVLYTADKQVRKATFTKAKDGKQKIKHEAPTIIGANIYAPAKVKVSWRQEDEDMHLHLDKDFTYEIYVINEPLFDPDSPTSPKHDEFARYFEILPDVDETEHYSLKLEDQQDKGSTRNPCMSVLLSR
jgi:hypothetical protein